MNSRYTIDNDLEDLHEPGGDREISLGTSTILGIFFALALICALFFGFGYSMGRRSAQPPAGTSENVTATSSSSSKPTPGSFASPATSPAKEDAAADSTADSTPATTTTADQPHGPLPGTATATPSAEPDKPATRPASITRVSAPATTYAAATAPVAATAGAATSMVQVAAVSHQEDADVLLSALKKRGYTVAIHQEPQDKLLHVQLGPFPTKKDADTMRLHLLADGYNAIVK